MCLLTPPPPLSVSPPPPPPGWLLADQPAQHPPSDHPGVPSPSGPQPPGSLRSCWCPGRLATSSAPPPLTPPCCPRSAASLAWCQAAWEPSPGRGTFQQGCGGEGEGVQAVPGGRGSDAQQPATRPPSGPPARPVGASPSLLSPESHKGTDSTGGLVKTVMCRSRQTNKSPYLFI